MPGPFGVSDANRPRSTLCLHTAGCALGQTGDAGHFASLEGQGPAWRSLVRNIWPIFSGLEGWCRLWQHGLVSRSWPISWPILSRARSGNLSGRRDGLLRTAPCALASRCDHRVMKDSLDHLPEAKRRDLARVVELLLAEFAEALAGKTAEHRRGGQILKIILFGSYARGDWVDDPVGGYVSDYDILVVVNHDELADVQLYWTKTDDRLTAEVTIHKRISAPVNFIVHSLHDVNKKLRRGRPFFIDIVRDGIALYEAQNHPFEQPQKLSAAEVLKEAEGYAEEWLQSAGAFLRGAGFYRSEERPKEAAFSLHQATERLYHGFLLVQTLYSPKSHRLNFLRSQCEQADERLKVAWPRSTRFEQRCFELLRRAYVDARYSPHYRISDEELSWLIERATELQQLVREATDERLGQLRQAAGQVGN